MALSETEQTSRDYDVTVSSNHRLVSEYQKRRAMIQQNQQRIAQLESEVRELSFANTQFEKDIITLLENH